MFFDPRRYDLAKVGRYIFNKKLDLKNRINGQVLAEDVLCLLYTSNVIFGGRLGEYKYYDMDAVIASALEMCEKELG